MKNLGLMPFPLRAANWAASGNDNISLEGLPKTLFGGIAHLAGISFDCSALLTLSSGSATAFEGNNIVNGLDIFDGFGLRFQGDFNRLRYKEALENCGRLPVPDQISTATAETQNVSRYWSVGPQNFAGSPSDYLLPCAALENGEIRLRFPAFASITANCTAATVTIRPIAWLTTLKNEIRVPPAYNFMSYTAGAADYLIQGRALYCYLALTESNTAPDAIAAGAFSAFALDTGQGTVPTVDAASLAKAFMHQNQSGVFNAILGEPRNAQDTSVRQVNPTTPTALNATVAGCQPVVWSGQDSRIQKLPYLAESGMRVRWTGTNTAATVLAGRIESQSANTAGAIAAKALARLGLSKKYAKIKTLSKRDYQGDRPDFMPWAIGV